MLLDAGSPGAAVVPAPLLAVVPRVLVVVPLVGGVPVAAGGVVWSALVLLHVLSLVLVSRAWWVRRSVDRGWYTSRARRHGR